MITVQEDFWREEERSGFLVSSEMKKVWAVEMEVLSQIGAICEKHKIPYFADYGTLLGAVRHQGFIPWDDDVDICLKRPDYERLMKLLPIELPEEYGVLSFSVPGGNGQPWSFVANAKEVTYEPERMKRFFGCPYVAGVDIYPLDYIPRDPELAQIHLSLYNVAYDAAQRFEELQETGELEQYLPQIEEICKVELVRDDTLRNQLWKLSDRIAAMFSEEESDVLSLMARRVQGDLSYNLKKEWYQDAVKMTFEEMEVPVPVGYREILTLMYGDYMEPVHGASAHEYPFYLPQKRAFGLMEE